jgi:dTDP-glucose 4,6-dehydratase
MRILIYGANGWIGSQFREICDRANRGGANIEYRASSVRNVSLSTQGIVIDELAEYRPSHVVSFLGRTHGTIDDKVFSTIDYLEQDGKLSENLRDNLVAPLVLSYLCKYANIHFTYLGTGCIFHYKDEDIQRMLQYDDDHVSDSDSDAEPVEACYKFKETDAPNFFGSSYSIVKGLTDMIMQERNCICENVLNLRIRMPIVNRDHPRNFITKITGYSKVCSLPNSMTVLDEFLPYALVLMQCRHVGTLNFVNPGVISHNEILALYRQHVNPDFEWCNFTVEEQNQILASKRSNNYLDNTKLLSLFPGARHIRQAVADCMKVYNAEGGCEPLRLDAIECTARMVRCNDNRNGNGTEDSSGDNNSNLGIRISRDVMGHAVHYAGECTRILSETVGTLYTKMLSSSASSQFEQSVIRKIMAIPKVSVAPGSTQSATTQSATTQSSSAQVMTIESPRPDSKMELAEAEWIDMVDDSSTVVCVTGGAGFIGSHFINFMWSKYGKLRIINLDCLYYCANISNVDAQIRESGDGRYTFYKTDLADSDAIQTIRSIFKTHFVTHVVHFAAQSHVQNSFGESLQYTRDNVLGTHNLLEAARLYGNLKRFIHVSTDEVYGESMIHDEKETCKTESSSVLSPTNPYAATKAAAEMIAQSYYHSFKLPLIITRGNNVYGPNQYPEKLIPRFIKLLQDGKKLTVQGNGCNIRSFIHVSDVCRAFDTVLSRGVVGDIYNIGGDESSEYSVIEIAKLLIKEIAGVNIDFMENASDLDWIEYVEDRPFNDKRYYISNEKLKRLGWTPQVHFIDGLRELLHAKCT